MQAIRQLVESSERGNGDIYKFKPCLNKSTLRDLRQIAEVMGVMESANRCAYAHLQEFQPSHARALSKHLRRLHGKKPADWPVEVVEDWVAEVEEKEWTVEQFEAALLASQVAPKDARTDDPLDEPCTVDDLKTLATQGKKFGCIYADPPWGYSNQATRAATDNHYPTMTVEEIAELPIGDLAAERSHLWLWTTNAFLFECPKLFSAWGFEFKSSYIWVKTQIGIGNYLRNAHEFLLLAIRGGLTGAARDVRSWDEYPRGEHSSKPERIRVEVVERLSPGPHLELFGRKPVHGWTVWGNQIRRGLFDSEVKELT